MSLEPRKTSRRYFLTGRSAWQAIDDALPSPESLGPEPAPRAAARDYLLQIGRRAMACDFEVLADAGRHPRSAAAALAALDLVDQLETQLTVYRPTSEVVEINRRAADGRVEVEAGLFQLLQQAQDIFTLTQGAFDITSGPLSRAWGFFRREGQFPSEEQVRTALTQVGSQWLELDPATRTIRFQRPGIEINLNAIGKGYALDRAAELMLAEGVADFVIHGGQSSILAKGSRHREEAAPRGWLVALRHPLQPDRRLAEVRLIDRALGTSGSGNQFFHFQGRRYGHVIDPRSGYPADQILSVTVLAPAAATADAMATAFFVLGVEESLAICSTLPDLDAIFVLPGRRAGEVEVVATDLNDEILRLLD